MNLFVLILNEVKHLLDVSATTDTRGWNIYCERKYKETVPASRAAFPKDSSVFIKVKAARVSVSFSVHVS